MLRNRVKWRCRISGLYRLRIADKFRVAAKLKSVQSERTSSETFGDLRKLSAFWEGLLRKQRTLWRPAFPSCSDSSRAKVSVPPILLGSTPKTETTDCFCTNYPLRSRLRRAFTRSSSPSTRIAISSAIRDVVCSFMCLGFRSKACR